MRYDGAVATVVAALVALSMILAGCAQPAQLLVPHQPGWQRVFKLDWEPGEYRGTPTVKGYLQNASPYTVSRIQLLVDALDGGGNIIAQKAAWVGSDMEPFTRRYFEVSVPEVAPQYRVSVYSYDSMEAPDGGSGPGPR